jgi:hypothetical protein
MLFFKARFLELIRAGRKRQTIRIWERARVKVGQVAYVPGLGAHRLRITAVDPIVRLADLTAADAEADGFRSCRAMLAEIRRLYPAAVREGRQIYRIRFKLVGAELLAVGEATAKRRGAGPRRRVARSSRGARADGGRDVRGTVVRQERLRDFLTALAPRMR